MFFRICYITAILATLSFTVFGQLEGNPKNYCRNGFFPRDSSNYLIARINGKRGERVYFRDDADPQCPRASACRTKSYLIAGNEVIVAREFDGFGCVWFQPAAGSETVGWIDLSRLEYDPSGGKPTLSSWLGTWAFYENEIRIKPISATELKIDGEAFWRGFGDNIHTGQLDFRTVPSAATMSFGDDPADQYGCRVTAHLAGRFLIVADNLNCGGANVTFTGVYRRTKAGAKK